MKKNLFKAILKEINDCDLLWQKKAVIKNFVLYIF